MCSTVLNPNDSAVVKSYLGLEEVSMCSTILNPNDSAVVSRVDETANSTVLGK